jgi:hypothetical protein
MPAKRDQRAANVRYYAANRQREIDRVTIRQAATVEFLRELRDRPCTDCGGRFHPVQMDFDHRDPSTKSFWLSRATLKRREDLLAEAAKCDVVCANCHRLRTRRQHQARLAARGPSTAKSPRIDQMRNRWRHKADLLDQIRSVSCMDCGGRFAPCAMEFDHRDPGEKLFAVSQRIANLGWERLKAEVDKCDIVCTNCHRLRTFERRQRRSSRAGVAQLEERDPSKVDVAGSNPVSRSTSPRRPVT